MYWLHQSNMQNCIRNLFSFDAETDGLYGPVWAIGAVVLDEHVKEIARFGGMIDPEVHVTDGWVKENVCQHVHLERFETPLDLRNAFWAFWMTWRENSICVSDFGTPVESGLFRACVEDDLENRQWNGPYPLHEVATALLCAGIDPDIDRIAFSEVDPGTVRKHNPVDDALVSVLSWRRAMHKIGR